MTNDEQYPRSGLLAEPSWLATRRDDPRVRIIDCGDAAAYARAHVPGAVRPLEHATEDQVSGAPGSRIQPTPCMSSVLNAWRP